MAPGVRPSAVSIFRCAPNPREPPPAARRSQEERDSQSPLIPSNGPRITDNLAKRSPGIPPVERGRRRVVPAHFPPTVKRGLYSHIVRAHLWF